MTSWQDTPVELGLSIWNFPPATEWPQYDIVGRGADLEPATLIHAYRSGVFPMSSDMPNRNPDMGWWSPMMRGILPLNQLRITRSMRNSARKYSVRIDTCFERVLRGCAVPNREGGWITKDIIDAYMILHELGWAHSFETFDESGVLIGGLYGVRVNGLFAGESMFHLKRDASKVALMHLVATMHDSAMSLLDVQWLTPHLETLGAMEIPRDDYLRRLGEAVNL
ncbi:MAG: leucyl/phenylalanyl-tRNA--protein transferase [bacterium]|jgi:leucyl/phenylalanyl-tRNA--protein transferase|nr:leucyl/phenylalanyl-tRNA--protein transferase [bacterium]